MDKTSSSLKDKEKEKKKSVSEYLKDLDTSVNGLSKIEAENRLARYGYNELDEKKLNPVLKFLTYFWGPIPWMIEIAAVLSVIVRHWDDFGIIMVLLLANAVVGFWEEYKADNTIDQLRAKLALKARAKRDGEWVSIQARELVPGDIIRLRIGDIIPADAILLDGDSLEIDQSALTGESLPVSREEGQEVYSGSIVTLGEIDALVHATGANTYMGKTVHLVEGAKKVSHFQRAVLKIGDYLIVVALALVILILAVALFRGDNIITVVQFVLVLTVAAIPVAMPTVLSVTMAVGAQILAKSKAIVSRLASIEELAGIDILCSDKTGTLTQNRLKLGDPFSVGDIAPVQVILDAALASREEDQDPIDLAVLRGMENKDLSSFKVVHFQPFDPVHKRTEALVKDSNGKEFKVSKGAPQVILDKVEISDQSRKECENKIEEFARHGFRSLGVARTDGQNIWRLRGVLPLYDPPREDSKETIETTKKMGVDMKMVTGDQVAIAKEIARQLGLGTNILDASLFSETKHHETAKLADSIEQADGFAQVFPEHKYHIVDVLQKKKHIVGMTGDGVNDAPALKKADGGIAVSGATDAARSAADITLLAPGISVVSRAIKESRKIFRRMTNYAIYRIAETIRVLLFMTLSILVFNFYPVTAVMIVLLALLNDGAILSIAYDRAHYSKKPERWDMHIVLGIATVLGIIGVVASFGMFYLAKQIFHLNPETIQTLMYLKLSVAGHLTIFITRNKGPFWSYRPAPILLGLVLGTQTLATFIAVFGLFMAPLPLKWALFVWGYALFWFMVNDLVKIQAYKIFDRHKNLLSTKKRRYKQKALLNKQM
jgi:H+-transporting ATPase